MCKPCSYVLKFTNIVASVAIRGYFETAGCVQNCKFMIIMVFCWAILVLGDSGAG